MLQNLGLWGMLGMAVSGNGEREDYACKTLDGLLLLGLPPSFLVLQPLLLLPPLVVPLPPDLD